MIKGYLKSLMLIELSRTIINEVGNQLQLVENVKMGKTVVWDR